MLTQLPSPHVVLNSERSLLSRPYLIALAKSELPKALPTILPNSVFLTVFTLSKTVTHYLHEIIPLG
jgi:hypothetical protein